MKAKRKAGVLSSLNRWFGRRGALSNELQAGRDVLAAVDAGGLPLNPARINQIARDLGLEVSRSAAVEETVERIRAAVNRGMGGPCAK